jgi:hypothetical protein
MAQGVLPIKYEEEKKDFGCTALGGTLVFLDFLSKIDFLRIVRRNLKVKENKQGWSDYHFTISLLLLNICGGDCVDDVRHLEKDEGLMRILKHLELRNVFGRRRAKEKGQWRNGKRNAIPSPSSIFRYLECFHNASQEAHREAHKAFIPAPNEHLSSLVEINKEALEFLQLNHVEKKATMDMDATLVESDKEEALYSYKNEKSFQGLNVWWDEQGYMVHTEFRDGNVPAGFEQKRVLIEALENLPEGVEEVYLRSDTAGYQHDLLKYCEKGENKRFGRIGFAIGCDVVEEFKKRVYEVEESEWHPICREVNGELKETGQEWAEVCFVPNEISRSKKGPAYRYLATRELIKQRELPGKDMEELCQQSFSFPNMKINNKRYKIFSVVTNLDWDGEAIIHWHRKRCGNSEHVHSEMKGGFCGGQLPSGKFGANAAWWWIMVLALNLTAMMKSLVLNECWKKRRMKSVRYSIINIAARVIKKGKEMIIRLSKGHPSYDLLISARKRIAMLCDFKSSALVPVPGG